MNEFTTITISKNTRERLGDIGNKNDKNMNEVISRLLDFYEENQFMHGHPCSPSRRMRWDLKVAEETGIDLGILKI